MDFVCQASTASSKAWQANASQKFWQEKTGKIVCIKKLGKR